MADSIGRVSWQFLHLRAILLLTRNTSDGLCNLRHSGNAIIVLGDSGHLYHYSYVYSFGVFQGKQHIVQMLMQPILRNTDYYTRVYLTKNTPSDIG